MTVRLAKKEDAKQLAQIHRLEIAKGFLASLPLSFLTKFYEAIVDAGSGICVVGEDEGRVVGFIAGTSNLKEFSRYFLGHYFFQAVFMLAPQIVHGGVLKKILESLRYAGKSEDLPSAELLTIAVQKEFQSQGVATRMLDLFISAMRERGVKVFKVVVGEDLKEAIAFYEKRGFRFHESTRIHGDKSSRIYLYHV